MNGNSFNWVPWAIGGAFGIISALIGVIYAAVQRRADKQDARIDAHAELYARHAEHNVEHISAMLERLKAAETEIQTLKAEVHSLRERWHEMRNDVTQSLASWYSNVVELVHRLTGRRPPPP
jgi:chromosome segregation ATPase